MIADSAENAPRARPKEDEALREEEVNRLKRKVGELTMDPDILREAAMLRPMTPGTSDEFTQIPSAKRSSAHSRR